jgi:hypothetical protein
LWKVLPVRFNHFVKILAMEGRGINTTEFPSEPAAFATVLAVPQIFKLLGAPMIPFC